MNKLEYSHTPTGARLAASYLIHALSGGDDSQDESMRTETRFMVRPKPALIDWGGFGLETNKETCEEVFDMQDCRRGVSLIKMVPVSTVD